MGDLHEKCVGVKFCFKLGKIFSETFTMLKQPFGNEAMSKHETMSFTNIIEDNECSG